jgi:hypothetical protein
MGLTGRQKQERFSPSDTVGLEVQRMSGKIKMSAVANAVGNIRRRSRNRYSAEEKLRIILEGVGGKEEVA